MKKTVITIFSIASICCILYYTIEFYLNSCLMFDDGYLNYWTTMCFVIVICLIVGVVNSIKLDVVLKQNKDLKNQLDSLLETITKNHFSELHQIQNCHESVLDIYDVSSGEGE